MNKKLQTILVVVIALLLVGLLLPPVPRTKARASRIQTVNHVETITFTLSNTNTLPAAPQNQ
jgi:hypothetical protein